MDIKTIDRLAREAGYDVEVFADTIRREALEEAAKIAESTVCDTHLPTGVSIYGTRAAAAIRALATLPPQPAPDAAPCSRDSR